jgi:hypothetical protein
MTGDYPHFVRNNPFRTALADKLPDYAWIAPTGTSRLGDANAILYDPDRFMPMRQGLHWFSDTPMTPDTRGWGNTLPRHVAWALFHDAATDRHLFVANVHLDHLSRRMNHRALEDLVSLLRRQAEIYPDGPVPIVVCGDFNEPATGGARAVLRGHFTSVLKPRDGDTRRDILPLQIDGIYLSPELLLTWADVDREADASDHRPVLAEFAFPTEARGDTETSSDRRDTSDAAGEQ